MKFEIEIKLRLPVKLGKIRRTLYQSGFRVARPRMFESNILFDNMKRSLRKNGRLIRIRHVGSQSLFTYKGPSEQSRYKKRREIELDLGKTNAMDQILPQIGLHPVFRYEKYRTEYAKLRSEGKVLLDETPIGNYLEIEGPPRWIERTARLLGFKRGDFITRSYGYLYLAYCRERRIRPKNMVFEDKELRRARKRR